MRNKAPIFVNGLSRGGTTILMNLLASHPHVGTVGEVHQVFKGSNVLDWPWTVVRKALLRELPIMLMTRQDFFSPRRWHPRRPLGRASQALIDQSLFAAKLRARDARLNRFKEPGRQYTPAELKHTRLLGKNLDGTVFLTDTFAQMYPDASFVGLLRDGLAFCEGHLRRGRSVPQAAKLYRQVTEKMLADAEKLPNYHVVRFEELLQDPVSCLDTLLRKLHLDPRLLRHVRMQRRRTLDGRGRHQLQEGREWDVIWYRKSALAGHFERDIDRRQMQLLADADREQFLATTCDIMQRLGYDTSSTTARPPQQSRCAA